MKSTPFRRLISVLLAVGVISGASIPAGAERAQSALFIPVNVSEELNLSPQTNTTALLSDGGGDECTHIHTIVQWDGIYWQEICQDCGIQTGSGVRLGGAPDDAQESSGAQGGNAEETAAETGNEAGNETIVDEAAEAPLLTNEVCYFCDTQLAAYRSSGERAYMVFDVIDHLKHRVSVTCPDCGDYRSTEEGHAFRYPGKAEQYDKEQHRTLKKCDACGYDLYEYESHDWKYGAWEPVGNSMYVRTKVCSVCGLDRSETETFDEEEPEDTPISGEQNNGNNTASGIEQRGSNDNNSPNVPTGSGGLPALPGNQPVVTEQPIHSGNSGQEESSNTGDSRSERVNTSPGGGSAQGNGQSAETHSVRRISVTVPEGMSLYITEQGAVYSADSAKIVNNSDGKVKVSGVTVEAAGDWTLAPYGLEMAIGEPSGKFIGFSLNGCATTQYGLTESLSLTGDWTIRGGGSLPLRYDAVMSLPPDLAEGEQVLTLVFVLDWA